MVKPVILQYANYVDQSTYQYKFPSGSIRVSDGDRVALAQASMFFTWFNITQAYGDNVFTYYWWDAAHPYGTIDAGNTYSVTYPDGYYTLNFPPNTTNTYQEYFEKAMIANKTYLIDATGEYVFFFEILWNNTYQRAQIVSYPIPTALPVGWSLPPGATWALPAVATCPVLNLLSTNNVPKLLGFAAGSYPSTNESATFSVLGTVETNFFPVTSVIVSCNILRNFYSSPPTNLYTIPIQNIGFGEAIEVNLGEYAFVDLVPGIYDSFQIKLLDQDYQPIALNDRDIVIYLLFDTKSSLNLI